jgi:hypothetical protein
MHGNVGAAADDPRAFELWTRPRVKDPSQPEDGVDMEGSFGSPDALFEGVLRAAAGVHEEHAGLAASLKHQFVYFKIQLSDVNTHATVLCSHPDVKER